MGTSMKTHASWPLLVVALAGGCAAPAPTTPPENRETRPPAGDAGLAACPATWQAAHEAPCQPATRLTSSCAYPGARCSCEPALWCVGPAPPPTRPHHLVCRALDPRRPLLDREGCPLGPVLPGARCDREGQVCRHRSCSYDDSRSTCRNGSWASEHRIIGPVPQ